MGGKNDGLEWWRRAGSECSVLTGTLELHFGFSGTGRCSGALVSLCLRGGGESESEHDEWTVAGLDGREGAGVRGGESSRISLRSSLSSRSVSRSELPLSCGASLIFAAWTLQAVSRNAMLCLRASSILNAGGARAPSRPFLRIFCSHATVHSCSRASTALARVDGLPSSSRLSRFCSSLERKWGK